MNDQTRPDPDALLGRIQAEEKHGKRGKLKIFFGSSAGVGKTYAMLSAAHEMALEGAKVAVGVVETHNRPETEKLLQGLTIIPPTIYPYRGMQIKELDLDKAKEIKPQILLVDELAHTNAPGARHPKRWHDVMELLDSGIDIYTSLNVQHIESLSDLVAGSTGVWVKETVPDSVFDAADDIVLVDIDADDLLKRLQEGKVYVAPQVKARAAESFFKKNNLIALREMALRRTAERVDAQMDAYNDITGHSERLAIAERILVCVGPDQGSAKLARTAKRMASAMKAPWVALTVETVNQRAFSENERRSIESLGRMVERIGGKAIILQGDSVADEILAFAKQQHFTKVIVGKPTRPYWQSFFRRSLTDEIIQKSGSIDVYVVTGDPTEKTRQKDASSFPFFIAPLRAYLGAFATFLLCTGFGLFLRGYITATDQALIYITGLLFAAIRLGLLPSLLVSFLSAAGYNFFFIEPYYTFGITHESYLVTFVVMLLTGYVVAAQASKLRLQAIVARRKEKQTQSFFRLTRELTSTRGRQAVAEVVARYAADMVTVGTTVWVPGVDGNLAAIFGALPEGSYTKELGVLQWCFDNSQIAGRNTSTMPTATGLYFPLISTNGAIGVLGFFPQDSGRVFTLDEISSLEMMGSLLSTAFERIRASEIAEQAKVKAESEKLRVELEKARDAILQAQQGNLAPSLEIYKPIIE